LPWQNLHLYSKSEKYQRIKEIKESTPLPELTKNCPIEFSKYMKYCYDLKFTDDPDYGYLKGLFTSLADNIGVNLHDKLYDWSVKAVTIS